MSTRRSRVRQAEKSEATRQALFDAATEVVGREGYAGASIGKITAAAGVAQGTFYYHFSSQQELFELLLPNLGERLLNEIREAIGGQQDILVREEIGFRTYLDFMLKAPAFYRVLSEAEVFAPAAYRTHMNNVAKRHLAALERSWEKGELPSFDKAELDVVTAIIAGGMYYVALRASGRGAPISHSSDELVRTFVKFVAHGLNVTVSASAAETTGGDAAVGAAPRSAPRSERPRVIVQQGVGPDIISGGEGALDLQPLLLRNSRTLLAEHAKERDFMLSSFTQSVIALPAERDPLVCRTALVSVAPDIAVLSLVASTPEPSERTLAVAQGIFHCPDASRPPASVSRIAGSARLGLVEGSG